jgi:colicin import membrane protein
MLRHNPQAMILSILLHLGLLLLFLWAREQQVSYMDSAAPILSPQPDESIPVVVEENRIAESLETKREDMALQEQKVIGLKRKESAELQALREEAEKERLRLEKLRQQAEEEKRFAAEREKRLEQERKAAAEKKRREEEQRKLAEEKRKKEAEKKRLAEEKRKQEEAEKQRLAEEQRQREEAERREREVAQEATQAGSTTGATARQSGQALSANQKRGGTGTGGAGRMSGGSGGKEYDKYIGMIRSKITRNWRRPPGTVSGLQVTLKVKLFPGGGVADVRIARSSGDPAFDGSAQEALQAADPLPVPTGKAFDRFRTLNLKFSPTGIQ